MKRIFIAIDVVPDPSFLKEVENIRRELRDGQIKWVDTQCLHLTLRFLGDTEEGQISRISEALSRTIAAQKIFQLRLESLGVFKSLKNARVIWVGCDSSDGLAGLKEAVDLALEQTGILPENRDFSPHFTLGRIKFLHSATKLASLLEYYRRHTFFVQEIKNLILYESILRPQGPEYIPLQTWQLLADSGRPGS